MVTDIQTYLVRLRSWMYVIFDECEFRFKLQSAHGNLDLK